MSLDVTKPSGTSLISELDDYQRETRSAVNSLELLISSGVFPIFYSAITLDLSEPIGNNYPVEVLAISSPVPIDLTHILSCQRGALKVLIFEDNDITVKYNASKIVLAGAEDITFNLGDILVLINQEGDPDLSIDGYWREVARKLF